MTGRNKRMEWIEWLKAIAIAVLLAFMLRSYIFATSVVEGESMSPALRDGERIIFNKFIYLVSDPMRGDIVIIEQPNKNYVKRVIGLPHETIEMRDQVLYINGVEQPTNFVGKYELEATADFGPIKIPENSYFVIGDNRAISKDSRNGLGFIPREDIIGRSELVIYPLDHFAVTR